MIISMARALEKKMSKAETYQQWKEAAIEYDERNGLQKWKDFEVTSRYDHSAIRSRLEKLRSFRKANDNHGLLYTLNEGIHGNMGGMGRAKLYQKARFGTKTLVSNYVDEVTSSLEHLSQPRLKGVNLKEQIDFFERASLCFGRSALMMSGSGTFLFFHVGVLKALWEQDLIPEVISGSSGGAFVAGVVGTRTHKDIHQLFDPEYIALESQLRTIFSNYFSNEKAVSNAKELQKIVEQLIPDLTFEEAYGLSGIQINISIAPAEKHQKSRLLNSVTSPNVMVREAVMASCSIP